MRASLSGSLRGISSMSRKSWKMASGSSSMSDSSEGWNSISFQSGGRAVNGGGVLVTNIGISSIGAISGFMILFMEVVEMGTGAANMGAGFSYASMTIGAGTWGVFTVYSGGVKTFGSEGSQSMEWMEILGLGSDLGERKALL
jgi:hypothetical protein